MKNMFPTRLFFPLCQRSGLGILSSIPGVCKCVYLPLGSEEEFGGLVSANLILLRNRLLDILLKLVHTSKEKTSINLQ